MIRSFNLFALSSLPLLLALSGCETRQSIASTAVPAPAPLSVSTAEVKARSVPRTITLTGTLTANRESSVAADVPGKVLEVYVERGARVAAGAPLIRLDRRQATLLAAEARSHAAAARSEAALAQADCTRADALMAEGAINRAEFDRARTRCEAAAMGASAASVRQQLAGKTLGDLIVRAPFAGVVAERLVNPGEYVAANTRVATVVQLQPLRLELAVPEAALAALGAGTPVSFQVATFPGQSFTGEVRHVGAAVRRATRDLVVEAIVPNADERLLPGMFATAQVALGSELLPVVPASAVRTDDKTGVTRAFVVASGALEERLLHRGPQTEHGVAIRAGLRAGERIVLSPAPTMRDGLRVR